MIFKPTEEALQLRWRKQDHFSVRYNKKSCFFRDSHCQFCWNCGVFIFAGPRRESAKVPRSCLCMCYHQLDSRRYGVAPGGHFLLLLGFPQQQKVLKVGRCFQEETTRFVRLHQDQEMRQTINHKILKSPCSLLSDLKGDWTVAVGGAAATAAAAAGAQGVLFFLRDGGLVASTPHLQGSHTTRMRRSCYVGANAALADPHVSVTRTRNTEYRDQPVDL